MKNLKKVLLLLMLSLTVIACSDDDSAAEAVIFAGSWSGTFTGGDSGTWEITVTNSGMVNGEAFSNNAQVFLTVTGNVDTSGEFRATAGSAENGATFTGTFTENSGTGTWENTAEDISGTWQGARN